MAARQHRALYVEVSFTGGVPTEQPAQWGDDDDDDDDGDLPGVMTIIHSYSVTVAQTKVPSLVPDSPSAVTRAMVINSHPVRTILTISNNTLHSHIHTNNNKRGTNCKLLSNTIDHIKELRI